MTKQGNQSRRQICRVCDSATGEPIFSASVLGRTIEYVECPNCRYVQTEEPNWLEQAYASVMNGSDTGIMARNQTNVGIVLATLSCLGLRNGRVVDFAGGYGILVRMLRDKGVDALWADPFCQNLVAVGFEHKEERADLVTAFEAFEHFVQPVAEMERIFALGGNLLLSTDIIPTPSPAPSDWWYYGLEHGQHVGFFRVETLEFLAKRFGKHLVTNGRNYHLFSSNPTSAHLWRLAIRIGSRMPKVFSLGRSSKVWSDHVRMSSPQ